MTTTTNLEMHSRAQYALRIEPTRLWSVQYRVLPKSVCQKKRARPILLIHIIFVPRRCLHRRGSMFSPWLSVGEWVFSHWSVCVRPSVRACVCPVNFGFRTITPKVLKLSSCNLVHSCILGLARPLLIERRPSWISRSLRSKRSTLVSGR